MTEPTWRPDEVVFTDITLRNAVRELSRLGYANYTHTRDGIRVTKRLPPIGQWNVSQVFDMSSLFKNFTTFNEDISNWNVRSVTNMSYMFEGATSFNQPVSNWKVWNVSNMSGMFKDATSFNQPLDWEDRSSVDYIVGMFEGATSFNQDLSHWNVYGLNTQRLFKGATSFNQPLNSWDLSNTADMSEMFKDATSFNQPLDRWDVSSVVKIDRMFEGATSFNQNLSGWNLADLPNEQRNQQYIQSIFLGSGMADNIAFMPHLPRAPRRERLPPPPPRAQPWVAPWAPPRAQLPPPPPRVVERIDPVKIHEVAGRISYKLLNRKLQKALQDKGIVPLDIPKKRQLHNFIIDSLRRLKDEIGANDYMDTRLDTGETRFNFLVERLNRAVDVYTDLSPGFRRVIPNALLYLNLFSLDTKRTFLQNWVHDGVFAYGPVGDAPQPGCIAGILERIVLSLQTMCLGNEENDCPEILIPFKRPTTEALTSLMRDWYIEKSRLRTTNQAEFASETPSTRKEQLKAYLINQYKKLKRTEREFINNFVDQLGDDSFEDDDFLYGGRRTRKRGRKLGKKRKTCKKRKICKRRKTCKRRKICLRNSHKSCKYM